MKNTKLAFCKFSKYPILKSIRVKFSRYKQKSMNVSVSFDTLILLNKMPTPRHRSYSPVPSDRLTENYTVFRLFSQLSSNLLCKVLVFLLKALTGLETNEALNSRCLRRSLLQPELRTELRTACRPLPLRRPGLRGRSLSSLC